MNYVHGMYKLWNKKKREKIKNKNPSLHILNYDAWIALIISGTYNLIIYVQKCIQQKCTLEKGQAASVTNAYGSVWPWIDSPFLNGCAVDP